MARFTVMFAVLAGLLVPLGGCQSRQPELPAGNLAFAGLGGTAWQLVEFQSMDDSQGTTRMTDRSKYTITFDRKGSVAVRLDCNRGIGTWSNPIANATGGTLEFGPIAVTKALCPPPSYGEKLEQHLHYVRSFVIRDGRLAMSLMADGGILVWEPAGTRN